MSYLLDLIQRKTTWGVHRSPRWPALEKKIIAAHPYCSVCGETKALVGHHIIPFHVAPAKELDPENIIVLCEGMRFGVYCHLWFGHLGDFRDFNVDVVSDADIWAHKLTP